MRFAALVIAGLALGACQTPCPAPYEGPTQVDFLCADGSALAVTFTRGPDLALVEEEGYAPLTLTAQISGTGYRYTGNGAEFRSRGADTRWVRPGARETVCRRADLGAPQEEQRPSTQDTLGY